MTLKMQSYPPGIHVVTFEWSRFYDPPQGLEAFREALGSGEPRDLPVNGVVRRVLVTGGTHTLEYSQQHRWTFDVADVRDA